MQIRDYAESIVRGESLAAKLAPRPDDLSDDAPVLQACPDGPSRCKELRIETDPRRKRKVPAIEGMPDPAQRLRIMHGFANHELQAVELFAWALLQFPEAPEAFRRGLLEILVEEQKHLSLYIDRVEALGGNFGDQPLSGYFWNKAREIRTPAEFCSSVGLTFESANLDHAIEYARAAREAGDPESAAVLDVVHHDEVGHVRFGWTWLGEFKHPSQSRTEAYLENVTWPLRPVLARGPVFHRESRVQAGLDEEFITMLEAAEWPNALHRFEKPDKPPGR